PLRLSTAAEIAFPDGYMTDSGLRREVDRGRLVIERIAGKLYTTLADIERMRALCREERRAQDYGCANQEDMATRAAQQSGLSSTETAKSSLDALLMMLDQPNESSSSTSERSTGRSAKRSTSKTS
ncbi:MAG: hypothetical protein AB7O79_10760, partial [Xanthobacteraceae bacterium]